MIGDSGDVINHLYKGGTNLADAGGKQPMSCWYGVRGSPTSNDISLNIVGRSIKSLSIGPEKET